MGHKPRHFRVQHTEKQVATFLVRPETELGDLIVQVDGAATHPEPDQVTVAVYRLAGPDALEAVFTDTLSSFAISGPNLFDSAQSSSAWPYAGSGYSFLYEIPQIGVPYGSLSGMDWVGDNTYQVEFLFEHNSGPSEDDYRCHVTYIVDVQRVTNPGA